MSQQLLDVSDLPKPFVDALEAAIQTYRAQLTAPVEMRRPGWAKGLIPDVPDSVFFDPLPEEVLRLFEGENE
ncbi:MAG TPA: hypothetical protein VHQ47_12925 [Phycisphaerae bacterium]|jgi:hypothetical protein|nr:hypothetical protein [Phycisphaerae bacterium]